MDWNWRYLSAVKMIQKWWVTRNNRPPNPLKIFSKMLRELKAAVKIQRWRRRLMFRSGKRIIVAFKNAAATKIQKALRRTILRTKEEMINHVYYCATYFNKMRREMFTDSQIKIAYRWRKYWTAKQKRLALEAEKLAKKKALAAAKKGKKGKSKKGKKGKKGKKKAAANADLPAGTVPDIEGAVPDEDMTGDKDDAEDKDDKEDDGPGDDEDGL